VETRGSDDGRYLFSSQAGLDAQRAQLYAGKSLYAIEVAAAVAEGDMLLTKFAVLLAFEVHGIFRPAEIVAAL
jgi:hypothetical protein